MAENTPETGWYDRATAAGQAQAVELEKVTQKILFSRVMFLVGVTCAFTALGAFVGKDLTSGTGFIFWIVALGTTALWLVALVATVPHPGRVVQVARAQSASMLGPDADERDGNKPWQKLLQQVKDRNARARGRPAD